jgi:hypothetical protein
MGAATWFFSALAAFSIARIIPRGRRSSYLRELTMAVLAAAVFGAIATALDFGGWRAPDWRAALFVLAGAATFIGSYRALRLLRT